ncbi:DUF4942 domain-containing protein [uncultured Psychrobacter sp.]|uniref:class I SAM-dependent methyltransferase n=1 Tax=uncultured Psychrobacter sp. TaxID=259303 RepID=UPI0030DA55C5
MSQPQPKSYLPGATTENPNEINEDSSWGLTTDEMLEAIATDISKAAGHIGNYNSVLDVGAADGSVLKSKALALRGYAIKKYGIEKAADQVCGWDDNITFVGGDLFENTLVNKDADVIFSHPPYNEFDLWAEKIINESYAKVNYLILPKQWKESQKITDALQERGFVATVILESDVLNHNQSISLNVDVIRVVSAERMDKDFMIKTLSRNSSYEEEGIRNGKYPFTMHYLPNSGGTRKEFSKLFPNVAKLTTNDSAYKDYVEAAEKAKLLEKDVFNSNETLADMVDSYIKAQESIFANYKKIDGLGDDLLLELNININIIESKLTERLDALKKSYWNAFAEYYKPINACLTSEYRAKLYSKVIKDNKEIDFTVSNALTVASLVIDAANQYQNEQVLSFFYTLSCQENIKTYKSNQKVFEDGDWRYRNKNDKYTLDYRFIKCSICGSISDWNDDIDTDKASDVIQDLCVIAKLVGVKGTIIYPDLRNPDSEVKYGTKLTAGVREGDSTSDLFTIKFYKNGNQHLALSKDFILRLNIYVGKLLGWVTNATQAFDEMQQDEFDNHTFEAVWDETVVKDIKKSDIAALGFLGGK